MKGLGSAIRYFESYLHRFVLLFFFRFSEFSDASTLSVKQAQAQMVLKALASLAMLKEVQN